MSQLALPVALVGPYLVCYLALGPGGGNTLLKRVLCAVSSIATVVTITTRDSRDVLLPLILLLNSLGSAAIWSSKKSVPRPITPSKAFLAWLRSYRLVAALDLLVNPRLINVTAPPGLAPRTEATTPLGPSRGYLRSLAYHFGYIILHIILNDVFTYPIYVVGINAPAGYTKLVSTVSTQANLHPAFVVLALSVNIAMATYQGLSVFWHIAAFFSIATGLWSGAEWPKLMNRPWAATSVSQLWSKRYHQLLRPMLLFWTSSFSRYPNIRLVAIFTLTALFHGVMYYPMIESFDFITYLATFGVAAIGCLAERAFLRVTGKRVGGPVGWVWTMAWTVATVQPLLFQWWSPELAKFVQKGMNEGMKGSLIGLLVGVIMHYRR